MDTGGLVLGAHVHAASLHDRDGAQRLLSEELKRELPRMELLWADGAYTRGFRRWAEEERGWRVEVPQHPDRQLWRYGLEEKPRGFLVLPRRWVVERTFAWLGQARRLAKDFERLPKTSGPCVLRRITLPRTRETRLGTSPRGGFPRSSDRQPGSLICSLREVHGFVTKCATLAARVVARAENR